MALLQHPLRALEQIEWYLDNKEQEQFPGAFLLASGNLARQVLEQILFILAFYSEMPSRKYLKSSNEMRTAGHIIDALKKIEPSSGRRYIELARRKGKRIRKFARYPRSLDRWRRLLNEPSHFSNPAAGRRTKESQVRKFLTKFKETFEEVDGYLITAAVNEIQSGGIVKAVLGEDDNNIPGVQCDVVVTPNDLKLHNGQLSLRTPKIPIQVIPDSEEVPYRWKRRIVLVQHSYGMKFKLRLIKRTGVPINITNIKTILKAFIDNPKDRRMLFNRLKKLGVGVKIIEQTT